MDARQVLQLLRWKESAEGEKTEHERRSPLSRQSGALAIVIGAQLLGVRQQLIAAHAQFRQRLDRPAVTE
jgi:hypothetical protein